MSWKDIPGRAAYLWIYHDWIQSNPRKGAVVAELGLGLGKSVAFLCEALDRAGRDDIKVYGVDIWNGLAINGEQQQLAADAGGCFSLYARTMLQNAPKAFERVNVIRMDSVPGLFSLGRTDLVVLDSDHIYDRVADELRVWCGSGWIGGDDFMPQHPGVEIAVREFFNKDFEVRHDCGWGTWLHKSNQ